jgi:hypothetical protein
MWFAITTSNESDSNGSDCTSATRDSTAPKPPARARAAASSTMPGDKSVSVIANSRGSSSFSQKRPVPQPHSRTLDTRDQSTRRASNRANEMGDVEYKRCSEARASSFSPVAYCTSRR